MRVYKDYCKNMADNKDPGEPILITGNGIRSTELTIVTGDVIIHILDGHKTVMMSIHKNLMDVHVRGNGPDITLVDIEKRSL